MALISPGVQVTVIDESNYTPAAAGTVPLVVVATAQDKTNPSGDVAEYTTAANAGRVFLVTSQRELISKYGKPNFLVSEGTPVHGYELNEYGLLAAYSALGVSNAAYIMRADINLAELTSSLTRPTGGVANNTLWLDTDATKFGIFEWNQSTPGFTNINTNNATGSGKLHLITDLGVWWQEKTGLPLPLGGNVVRRDLGNDVIIRVSRLLRQSIQYALDHRDAALEYALKYGRDLDTGLADRFVGMYVNHWTLDYGERGRAAVRELLRQGAEAGTPKCQGRDQEPSALYR